VNDAVKVLLLAGSGRSGSTVLANLLGSVDGAFSGGELRYLWERGLRDDRLCGCGQPFRQCDVWRAVLDEAVGGADAVDAHRVIATARQGSRIRHLPLMLLGQEDRLLRRLDDYPAMVASVYRAIRDVTGSSLIVDSSKLPGYGYLLDRLPDIDLRVLHLVRDPRAAAYSWSRKKPLRDGAASATMEQQSAGKSAVLWNVWNLSAAALWAKSPDRYLRLGYEEFVRRPRASVARILEFAGHDADLDAVFADDRTVRLIPSHTVAGNPDRLRTGEVALRLDDEWRSKMRPRDRALVTALTGPLLPMFSLPWRGGSPTR
jgi:hypothetical protein